jgi:hypothetical protein
VFGVSVVGLAAGALFLRDLDWSRSLWRLSGNRCPKYP